MKSGSKNRCVTITPPGKLIVLMTYETEKMKQKEDYTS